MPGKRSTTPLFDLLQQRRPKGGVEVRVPEPQVERAPAEPPPAARDHSSRFADVPIRIVGGVIHMPLAYGAAALTVALVAILLAWTLGYQRGDRNAKNEQEMLETVMGSGARIVEPGEGQGAPTGDPGAHAGGQPAGGSGASPASPGGILTVDGADRDPRTPGFNYLHLAAKLEPASAMSAIEHLESRGIEAFAEIDPTTLRRKNGPLYTVIAARGVPGDDLKGAEARRFRDQVLAAGAAWKQAGGKWDFADAYWKKFTPKG